MVAPYPRGSEWRKWDLQVQTILDDRYVPLDQYSDSLKQTDPDRWREYVGRVGGEQNALLYDSKAHFKDPAIEKTKRCLNYTRNLFSFLEVFQPGLACIGITDHNYFDDTLIDTLMGYSQRSKCKLLPGVEINCEGIHMLLFFSKAPCEQSTYSEGITTLLKRFGINNRTASNGVLALATIEITALMDLVTKEEGLVIFPHCNGDNGLFQERGRTDRSHLARIFNHQPVTLLQTQNLKSIAAVENYIGTNEKLISKACSHISPDSRALRDIGKDDDEENCTWIKADPTFEGLKQIVFEPKDRVYVGPTPPIYHDQARIIRSVKLSNGQGWFSDTSIPLNNCLVSIIGQKGSGKSALAEVIAFAAGAWHGNQSASFLERADGHLNDLAIELEWADDTIAPSITLATGQPDSPQVRYLSQRFVERLCAEDRMGGELVREIESVIFSSLDPIDTLNASSFEELRAMRTEGTRAEGERLRGDIMRLIREEFDLIQNVGKLKEKKERIKALVTERSGLVKQLPKAVSAEDARIQKELQEKREKLTGVQQACALEKQKLQKLNDIRAKISAFKVQIGRFCSEIESLLRDVGIKEAADGSFKPIFPHDTETVLARREAELKTALAAKEGSVENPAEGTVRWLQAQIEALVKKDTADKARQQKTKVTQSRISTIGAEIGRIQAEIDRIEGPEKERIIAARQERRQAYIAFFVNLKDEEQTLKELYIHLNNDGSGSRSHDLEFSIRWEAEFERWLERGGGLFDQRKALPYGTMAELGKTAGSLLVPAWISGNPEKIGTALETFLEEFRKPENKDGQYLRSDVTWLDLLQWLYEVDHVKITYGLKYNGVELEKLSPGTKGIVLLIVYLGMDTNDTRPLIVDQPDENLDNESIYKLLTSYFKAGKTRRQIILITHNPNLVVNGDSEQVIVATCNARENGLPHLVYSSGSLENDAPDGGIRRQVCRILEGGSDAFRKRELRYSLPAQVE